MSAAAGSIILKITMFPKVTMENFGATSEMISEAMNEMQNNHSFSYMAIFQNYANALLRNAIFGLLVAVVMKKS